MERLERQRKRLQMLVDEAGTQEILASKMGSSESYISQLLTQRSTGINGKFCRRLEQAMAKPDGWMDQWLPEEAATKAGKEEIVSEHDVFNRDLSETERRVLVMWRTWEPHVKHYAFGQLLLTHLTKDVLRSVFVSDKKKITNKDVDKYAIDTVTESGKLIPEKGSKKLK